MPTVVLTPTDLNAIKFNLDLAVNKSTTFISFTSSLVPDMAGNAITAATDAAAKATLLKLTQINNDVKKAQLDPCWEGGEGGEVEGVGPGGAFALRRRRAPEGQLLVLPAQVTVFGIQRAQVAQARFAICVGLKNRFS